MKINCNATWNQESKEARIGIVARNKEGRLIGVMGKLIYVIYVLNAEAKAIRDGIHMAIDEKWTLLTRVR